MSLVSAGSNAQGQLATGDCEDAHTFTECHFQGCERDRLPAGTQKVVQIACGANHTLVLLDRVREPSSSPIRELWGCGDGSKGQILLSVTESSPVFVPMHLPLEDLGLAGYGVRMVAACWETSYLVLSHPERSDVLLSMGSDDFGDLGIGGTKGKSAPTTSVHRIEFDRDCGGTDEVTSIRVLSLVAGPHHVIVRFSVRLPDGSDQTRLVGWGTSRHGQLGDLKDPRTHRPLPFSSIPRAVSLSTDEAIVGMALGNQHSVFQLSSGTVIALGSNRKGQINGLAHLNDVQAIGCTWNATFAVVRHGDKWSIVCTGSLHTGQLGQETAGSAQADGSPLPAVAFPFSFATHELLKMACGSEHVLCLFQSRSARPPRNEVWAWGWNEHGTLGCGTTVDEKLPVKVWPPDDNSPKAVDIAGGYGNSWIVLEN